MNNPYNLVDALERTVEMYPENTAFHCGDESWTYREFRDRAVRAAAGLSRLGVESGDRIAVLGDNCHRFAELYWVAARLGAILIPLGTRLSEAEMSHILDETAPKVLATDDAEREDLLRRLYPAASHHVGLGEETEGAVSYEALAKEDHTFEEPPHSLDDPVVVFYTAATEGKPLGAVVTHGNWLAQAVQTGARIGTGPDDVYGTFLPLYHTFEGYMTLVSLCHGASNVVTPTFDAAEAARLVEEHGITYFTEFAPMAQSIMEAADGNGADLTSLTRVIGIDLPTTIVSYLERDVRWFTLYGQAEVAGMAVMGELEPGDEVPDNYVGRPLALTRVSLRDANGEPIAPGGSGEAWLRSGAVVDKYWPDQATRLTEDGWLRSGDLFNSGYARGVQHLRGGLYSPAYRRHGHWALRRPDRTKNHAHPHGDGDGYSDRADRSPADLRGHRGRRPDTARSAPLHSGVRGRRRVGRRGSHGSRALPAPEAGLLR